jgi:hypothetical protein
MRLLRRERGAAMVLAAMTVTVLVLIAGLALDFGRIHLLRTHLQTAVDAASLAGALQAVPVVDIRVTRRYATECLDPISGEWYECWEDTSPVVLTGPWARLVRDRGYRREPACTYPYRCSFDRILRQWWDMPPSAEPVARDTFWQNAVWPVTGPLGPQVQYLEVEVNTAEAEVTATAGLRAPTTFLRLAGIDHLDFVRSGSAAPVWR